MRCPECKSRNTKIIDSRTKGERKWRRHECENAHRFTTWEIREVDLGADKDPRASEALAKALRDLADQVSNKLLDTQN